MGRCQPHNFPCLTFTLQRMAPGGLENKPQFRQEQAWISWPGLGGSAGPVHVALPLLRRALPAGHSLLPPPPPLQSVRRSGQARLLLAGPGRPVPARPRFWGCLARSSAPASVASGRIPRSWARVRASRSETPRSFFDWANNNSNGVNANKRGPAPTRTPLRHKRPRDKKKGGGSVSGESRLPPLTSERQTTKCLPTR